MAVTRDKIWRAIQPRKARTDVNLQQSGKEQIPASVDVVWAFVTDPHKAGR